MKHVLLILLLISATFSLQLKSLHSSTLQASSLFENKLTKAKEENEMSGLIIDLAALHMSTEGPLEDLTSAVTGLIEDLTNTIDKENLQFEDQTAIHQAIVTKLQQDLDHANAIIGQTKSLLEVQLKPRKQQVETTIDHLQVSITNNLATTEKESQIRVQQHNEFLQKDAEYGQAIEACNEAIDLMQKLLNGEGVFIQTPHAPETMKKVLTTATKLNNNKFTLFIKALASIGKGYSDQEVVSQVLKMLQNLLSNLQDGKKELINSEEETRRHWEEIRLPQLKKELENLKTGLAENLSELENLENEISNKEKILREAEARRTKLEGQLNTENETWNKITEAHNSLIARLANELEGTQQAFTLLSSRQFSEYFHTSVNRL